MALVYFIAGLTALILGAEALVRGSSRLALAWGISPLVVGLTVVAFGTSAPELAISLGAAWAGQPDIALGNAVGSNIFNVLFILGLSALITPLVVDQQLVRQEVPLMILASVVLWALSSGGVIDRLEGLALAAMLCAYIAFAIRQSRREPEAIREEYKEAVGAAAAGRDRSWTLQVLVVLAGLVLLVVGARWLVSASVDFARALGVSELVIGLTLIAAGTSLPEVATSLVAALRGERDIAVGNVVGSNIFNIFGVLGFSAALAPVPLRVAPALTAFDVPVMVAASVACLPIFYTGSRIARWEGGLFFVYYLAYTVYLILRSSQHDALEAYGAAMRTFVLPLTAVTLVVLAVRSWRRAGARSSARHRA